MKTITMDFDLYEKELEEKIDVWSRLTRSSVCHSFEDFYTSRLSVEDFADGRCPKDHTFSTFVVVLRLIDKLKKLEAKEIANEN